ncbi:MAG: hypothetical protein PHW83_12475, partial [Bacteroidales bacterium]|nr:hypothetical protein [Bacteroidales bacterium]
MHKSLSIIPLLVLISFVMFFVSCKKSLNWDVECDEIEEQIFSTDFTNDEVYEISDSRDRIRNIDTTENDWDILLSHSCIGDFHISYEDGTRDQRYAEICPDPLNTENEVIKFKIIEPHIREGAHKKGRVQLNLNDNKCIKEFYQTVRLYIHPDMEYLKQWEEKVHWLSFFEFWNNANFAGERNPFRISVSLFKTEDGPVDEMYFAVVGDRDIRLGGWDPIWVEINEDFSVPFGEWMDIEIYLKEGDSENGRFYMTVTPQSGEKLVLFDVHN